MRTVVIDTNCLLQIISRQSPYFPIWQAFRDGRFILCVSNEIISEYLEIIERETTAFVADGVIRVILNSQYCLLFNPQYNFHLITQDPDDNKFVDCAIVANADYIVSEDSHFRVLAEIPFPKVNVVSLDNFLRDFL